MREINEIQTFIDDEFINEMADVQNSSHYLNPNTTCDKCMTSDSGIIYDPEERDCSELSISNKTNDGRTDSGIDSISKIPSIREFKSLSKSSIKSSSVSTVAVPLREQMPHKSASKLRSKRYSLPDIDKLKAYNDITANNQCTKKSNNFNGKPTMICDISKDSQQTKEQQQQIHLVPTEVKPLDSLPKTEKPDTFNIDPKLINKYDGLSQSLYYIDENGSPKIRERFIKQQRILIEKQEQKKREKAARKSLESEASCSCFNFSRLSKKLKELCKFFLLLLQLCALQPPVAFPLFFLIFFLRMTKNL